MYYAWAHVHDACLMQYAYAYAYMYIYVYVYKYNMNKEHSPYTCMYADSYYDLYAYTST